MIEEAQVDSRVKDRLKNMSNSIINTTRFKELEYFKTILFMPFDQLEIESTWFIDSLKYIQETDLDRFQLHNASIYFEKFVVRNIYLSFKT